MKFYTGIGSRETPEQQMAEMTMLAMLLEQKEYTLRSGGADGADTAFEKGTKRSEIYLPWPRFNGRGSHLDRPTDEALTMAAQYHPAWHRCSEPAKLLHARNCHQVLGRYLTQPSEFVICWTPNGELKGGTAQAMRIAMAHDIPIYNLGTPTGFETALMMVWSL